MQENVSKLQEVKEKLFVDGDSESVDAVDGRFQMLLHQELIDFFSYKRILELRLLFLLQCFQFKSYQDVERYYLEYVKPNVGKELSDESD